MPSRPNDQKSNSRGGHDAWQLKPLSAISQPQPSQEQMTVPRADNRR